MPVRSSSSSVLKWPRRSEVLGSLRTWAEGMRESRGDLIRAGYFGSLRRGDWGVGSDVDLVVVLETSDSPPIERPLEFDLSSIPVGADLLVYTKDEWNALLDRDDRFAEEMRNVVWL